MTRKAVQSFEPRIPDPQLLFELWPEARQPNQRRRVHPAALGRGQPRHSEGSPPIPCGAVCVARFDPSEGRPRLDAASLGGVSRDSGGRRRVSAATQRGPEMARHMTVLSRAHPAARGGVLGRRARDNRKAGRRALSRIDPRGPQRREAGWPLHEAAAEERIDVARYLVAHSPDPTPPARQRAKGGSRFTWLFHSGHGTGRVDSSGPSFSESSPNRCGP